jgi:hypothetical protein
MVRITRLVVATDGALADPDVQAQVRQMHADDTPLLDMVDALGLGDFMTDEIRAVLQDLSPDVVAGIRQATLDALDAGRTEMPLDCDISEDEVNNGVDVQVDVVQSAEGPTIQIRPA